MKHAPFDNNYHLKWDLIEDPFPTSRDKDDGGHRFNLEQTGNYLEICVMRAGGDEQFIFSEDDIREIHMASGGIPGRINRLARQRLCDPADVVPVRDPARLRFGLWLVGGAVAIAILVLLSLVVIPDRKSGQDIVKDVGIDLPAEAPATKLEPEAVAETDATEAEPVLGSEIQTVDQVTLPATATETPVPETSQVIKTEPPAAEIPAKPVAVKPAPVVEKKTTTLVPGIKGRDWIRTQDPQQYALQLVGARELATIRRFLSLSGLNKVDLALVNTGDAKRDWYVLLYGIYPGSAEARQAIARLPDYVKQHKPWPRQLKSLSGE